ncbi:MAG: hypothetical protein GX626_09840 [Spirochaetales bacterium]|nr:hypothetical protein [Spirochaetales bacterium]
MKKIFTILMLAALALPLAAQILPSTSVDPKIDGIFQDQEYAVVQELRGMKFGYALSRDGQTLHFALQAPTTGWVSIGLGSNRMQGAHIVIGFDALASQSISEETGRGHSHSPSRDKIVKQQAIKESGSVTTLEFSVPASLYAGGRELRTILAYGTQDDLRSKHTVYASHTIAFAK